MAADAAPFFEPWDASRHDASQFRCGVAAYDDYLQSRLTSDQRRRAAVGYVMADPHSMVLGYYTLSAGAVLRRDLPRHSHDHVARYRDVPAFLLGRLALDERHQGRGLGNTLLTDSLQRCLWGSRHFGASIVLVDPLPHVVAWYPKWGFRTMQSDQSRMFITLRDVEAAFAGARRQS